jgi:hypothetical protein
MQKGFAVGWILVLLAIVGTAAATYYYLNHKASLVPDITNYEECEKADGSKIQDSYPPVCKTIDGQSFIKQVDPKTLKPD